MASFAKASKAKGRDRELARNHPATVRRSRNGATPKPFGGGFDQIKLINNFFVASSKRKRFFYGFLKGGELNGK